MPFRHILTVLLLLLIPTVVSARDCPSVKSKDPRLLIFPFVAARGIPPSEAPTLVIPVLLKEYLSQSKGIVLLPILGKNQATFNSKTAIKKGVELGAQYLLIGNLDSHGNRFELSTRLLSPDGKEIQRFQGSFEFPSTMNELLLGLVEQVSPRLIGKKLGAKKILPYLNAGRSASAYLAYAEGEILLQDLEKSRVDQTVQAFEKAIQSDYNYIQAYLGLSEALAAKGFFERVENSEAAKGEAYSQRARVELEKAKLLNPTIAKLRERRIEWYLKGEINNLCRG